MKHYTREQLVKDVISGIIVAIIALPLSIALALASGVTPEQGLYTAIVVSFLISFLGGSKVQTAGPTAAFASIVFPCRELTFHHISFYIGQKSETVSK